MFNTIKNRFLIKTTANTNALLYFIKRLPILKRKIPDSIYRSEIIKLIMIFWSAVKSIFTGILMSFSYIFALIFLPIILCYQSEVDSADLTKYVVYLIFILSFIMNAFFNAKVFSDDDETFTAVKIMKMNPKSYAVYNAIFVNIQKAIYIIPPIWLVGFILKGSALNFSLTLLLAFEILMFMLVAEGIIVALFVKRQKHLEGKYKALGFSVLTLLAYIPFFFDEIPNLVPVIESPVFIILSIIMAALSLLFISKTSVNQFGKALNIMNTLEKKEKAKKVKNAAAFGAVVLDEKKFSAEELHTDIFSKLSGYDYLNAIFFKRHKRMMVMPVLIVTGIIGLLGLAVIIIGFFKFSLIQKFKDILPNIYPSLLFVMYVISTCPKMTRAMFYNCDSSLLRFNFYRERNAMLSNFRYRLLRVIFANLIPAIALSLVLGLTIFAGGAEILTILILSALIIMLSIFFSVHHLFLYYILQPYTSDMNIKNPLFKFINGFTYMICYLCMTQVHTAPKYFTVIVLGLTIIYIPAALYLVVKLAPKNFRVK